MAICTKRHWPEALDRYEQQEQIMGTQRSSYSKADTDPRFMRMKEGHMKSIHQQSTDTSMLIPHIEHHVKRFHQQPNNITADAGYGSEQNYKWMETSVLPPMLNMAILLHPINIYTA